MLTELRCTAFKDGKRKPRPLISFHAGLNIVSGREGSSGSVGKSTFLMVVDFVFGGDDYFRKMQKIVHRHVTEHEVYFAFEFGGEKFCFIRTTKDIYNVIYCGGTYALGDSKTWAIDEYRDWLFEKYGLPTDNANDRSHISRFFRIYHRNNFNEKHPLIYTEGGNLGAIDCLLQLAGEQALRYAKNELNDAENRLKTFRRAIKFDFIPFADTDTALWHMKNDLETELNALTDPRQIEYAGDSDAEERHNAANLSRLFFLRQKRGHLEAEIRIIENNEKTSQSAVFADKFDALLEFFPNANKERLVEIETFHAQMNASMAKTYASSKANKRAELAETEEEIAALENETAAYESREDHTAKFAQKYYAIKVQIDEIERKADAIKKLTELENAYEQKKRVMDDLERAGRDRFTAVARMITRRMWVINEILCGTTASAPDFFINALDEYDFQTFDDGGTSAAFRALVDFDLAILKETPLPAVAHDFVVLSNIDSHEREKLFAYYAEQTDKQIFIAIDNLETYDKKTQKLLAPLVVLYLSTVDNDVLYGEPWNTKEKQEDAQMSLDEVFGAESEK